MRYLKLFFIFFLLPHTVDALDNGIALDIKSIARNTEAVVEKLVGQPENCELLTVSKHRKCYYLDDKLEIVYINGKADWITYYPENTKFHSASLLKFNLDPTIKPSFFRDHVIRWENSQYGLKEVSIFPGAGGNISYIYVKSSSR